MVREEKGKPKRDGSGRGKRLNKGRGGCKTTKIKGKGRTKTTMAKTKKWIQEAKPKKGALSKQLNIPEKKNIPMALLNKIVKAKPGEKIKNPTKVGDKTYKVTKVMGRRAIMARNLKRM